MPERSPASLILLVANLSTARGSSAKGIPWPSSSTITWDRPPSLRPTVTLAAPASREFSINSFTTEAGFSITSPAAIRRETSGGSCLMGFITTSTPPRPSPSGSTKT